MPSNSRVHENTRRSRLAALPRNRTRPSSSSATTAWASTCATPTSFSAFFSASIGQKNLREQAWALRLANALFIATEARSGPRACQIAAPRSTFLFQQPRCNMSILGRILLVEDDPRDIELTLTALQEYNLVNDVFVARDGQEALDYLYCRDQFSGRDGSRPAVMLLDLKLPKINGLEVLQQIRSDQELRLLPVVILTSSHEEKDLVRSYELGVNAYVVKPVDFHAFVNAVKDLGVFWAMINEPPPGSMMKKSP